MPNTPQFSSIDFGFVRASGTAEEEETEDEEEEEEVSEEEEHGDEEEAELEAQGWLQSPKHFFFVFSSPAREY